MSGPRSEAPVLPGFTPIRWLGGGGFADVFLYLQHKPERQVAVKVLRAAALDQEALDRFDEEANLMARVSTHPHIVTVYTADVAADGRPYLVMEYYPKPHFGERCRAGGLPVADVLKVGIQVSSAVATAHGEDIVHRDIKPANVLVSAYDFPGLTDFGIAGAIGSESAGVTPQYTAPEVLAEESPGDFAADVYSLAATIYALAAGRSPFEVPGGDNRAGSLVRRVLNDAVPGIGRPDLPRSLEHLLAQALSKRPAQRPPSVAAFAAGLRDVELELRLAATPFELGRPGAAGGGEARRSRDDEDGTRHRLQVVRPDPPPAARPPVRLVVAEVDDHTAVRGGRKVVAPPVEPLVVPAAPPAPTDESARDRPAASTAAPPATARRRRRPVATVVATLVVAAAGAAAVASFDGGDQEPPGHTTTTSSDTSVFVAPPRPPGAVLVTAADNGYAVSFEAPGAKPDDRYQVVPVDASGAVLGEGATSPIRLTGVAAGTRPPCVKVVAIRGDQLTESQPACPQ